MPGVVVLPNLRGACDRFSGYRYQLSWRALFLLRQQPSAYPSAQHTSPMVASGMTPIRRVSEDCRIVWSPSQLMPPPLRHPLTYPSPSLLGDRVSGVMHRALDVGVDQGPLDALAENRCHPGDG